jgi:hypothetical protein
VQLAHGARDDIARDVLLTSDGEQDAFDVLALAVGLLAGGFVGAEGAAACETPVSERLEALVVAQVQRKV